MSPSGPRFEVERRDDGWHTAVYWRRSGGNTIGGDVITEEDVLAEKIAGLEAKGYVRQQDGVPPPAPPATESAGIVLVVVGIVLFLVVVAVLAS